MHTYDRLNRKRTVFKSITGMKLNDFESVYEDFLLAPVAAGAPIGPRGFAGAPPWRLWEDPAV